MPNGTLAPSIRILLCLLACVACAALGRATSGPAPAPAPSALSALSPFTIAPDAEANHVLALTTAADRYRDRIERALREVVGEGRFAVTVSVDLENAYDETCVPAPEPPVTTRREKHEAYDSGAQGTTRYRSDQVETKTTAPEKTCTARPVVGQVRGVQCALALADDLPESTFSTACQLALAVLPEKRAQLFTTRWPARRTWGWTVAASWALAGALMCTLAAARRRRRGIID